MFLLYTSVVYTLSFFLFLFLSFPFSKNLIFFFLVIPPISPYIKQHVLFFGIVKPNFISFSKKKVVLLLLLKSNTCHLFSKKQNPRSNFNLI